MPVNLDPSGDKLQVNGENVALESTYQEFEYSLGYWIRGTKFSDGTYIITLKAVATSSEIVGNYGPTTYIPYIDYGFDSMLKGTVTATITSSISNQLCTIDARILSNQIQIAIATSVSQLNDQTLFIQAIGRWK